MYLPFLPVIQIGQQLLHGRIEIILGPRRRQGIFRHGTEVGDVTNPECLLTRLQAKTARPQAHCQQRVV